MVIVAGAEFEPSSPIISQDCAAEADAAAGAEAEAKPAPEAEETEAKKSRSEEIEEKLRGVLEDLGLTPVGRQVAYGWIREQMAEEECARVSLYSPMCCAKAVAAQVRRWMIMKCNKQNFPKGDWLTA